MITSSVCVSEQWTLSVRSVRCDRSWHLKTFGSHTVRWRIFTTSAACSQGQTATYSETLLRSAQRTLARQMEIYRSSSSAKGGG
jgi:hypothetical protein